MKPRLCEVCGVKPVWAKRAANIWRATTCSDRCKWRRDWRKRADRYKADGRPTTLMKTHGEKPVVLSGRDLLDYPDHIIEEKYQRARLAKRARWQPVAQRAS